MIWLKLCKSTWNPGPETVHGTLRFLYLSHLLYGICVKIFLMNRYISKSYTTSKNAIVTDKYRAGAAVASTVTSLCICLFFLGGEGAVEGPHAVFQSSCTLYVPKIFTCLVPVRRLFRPSRSMHFGDVSETNGRETPRQSRSAHACAFLKSSHVQLK